MLDLNSSNLAQRCFGTYSLRKVRSPLEKNKMDPIFQDGRPKKRPFVAAMDNRGSDRLDTGHWTTCGGLEHVCQIWSWWCERFSSYVDYKSIDKQTLCIYSEQITETIVHLMIQAPNLSHKCFGTYSLRQVRGPLEKQTNRHLFSRWPPFEVVLNSVRAALRCVKDISFTFEFYDISCKMLDLSSSNLISTVFIHDSGCVQCYAF